MSKTISFLSNLQIILKMGLYICVEGVMNISHNGRVSYFKSYFIALFSINPTSGKSFDWFNKHRRGKYIHCAWDSFQLALIYLRMAIVHLFSNWLK